MLKRSIVILCAAIFLVPSMSYAHERHVIRIGGVDHLFVVGSLGEPVVVDDKTGLELTVKIADPKDPTNASAPGAKPAVGLERSLKLELTAGDKKKIQELSPAFGNPGAYKTTFYPTIQTTLSYRLFGIINDVPVDLSFTCNPAGHVAEPENKDEVTLSENVVRTYKTGQFGCPLAKSDLGFPEIAMTSIDLHEDTEHHLAELKDGNKKGDSRAGTALFFGVLGTVLGGIALRKATKKPLQ